MYIWWCSIIVLVSDLTDSIKVLKHIRRKGLLAKVVIIVYSDLKSPGMRGLIGGLKSAYGIDIKKTLIIA